MAIYFAFSDENGDYERERGPKFIKVHPFFIRATLLMDSKDWRALSDAAAKLRSYLPVASAHEIKWSHIWSLRIAERDNRHHDRAHALNFLSMVRHDELLAFAGNMLGLLKGLSFGKVILTVTCNKSCARIGKDSIYKMHLQEAMQRIEMEMDSLGDALTVFFVDPISRERDDLLRNAYHGLYLEGDFKKYRHIMDSLNMQHSHQSVGIQLADFIAGCFGGFLRGFDASVKLFNEHVRPSLRRSQKDQILGWGIREVPRTQTVREWLGGKTTITVMERVEAELAKLKIES